ncbi:MAG: hypothetical protein KJ901_13590 [Gammaproteobacteria bacterium]|nr:hypothetical protein [Gammaproteobacteria bacterium]
MDSNEIKSPSRIADEAETAGREAFQATQGYARESKRIGRNTVESIRANVDDARQTGREAMDAIQGLSSDAKEIGKDALNTGRVYARDAVNATGGKIRDLRGRMEDARESAERYVAEEPVRAMLIAAGCGALVMALLLAAAGRRPYRTY